MLSGLGSLTKLGAGTLVTGSINTFTGGLFLNAGTLSVSSDGNLGAAGNVLNFNGGTLWLTTGFSTARNVVLNGPATWFLAAGTSSVLSGWLYGSGSLTLAGAGTLTLATASNFTGNTVVAGGSLVLANPNALALSTLDLSGAGTVVLGNYTNATFGGLTGSSGSIALQSASGGPLVLNVGANNASSSFAGVISGPGSLLKAGSGTLSLSNANTFGGTTRLSGGFIGIGNPGALGSGTITFDGGGLQFTNALVFSGTFAPLAAGTNAVLDTGVNAVTFASVLSGAGGLAKTGAGTLLVTGQNTFTGNSTVAAGVLQLGTGGTTGAIVGDIVNSGTVAFNRSDAVVFAGSITGSGGLLKHGTGDLTLSGANAYAGLTNVAAGRLLLTGSIGAGALTVQNGAQLMGTTTVSGGVTLLSGGSLQPGNAASAGVLTLGALSLSGGGALAFRISAPSTSDRINVTGTDALTLTGSNTVNLFLDGVDIPAIGRYTLLSYTGARLTNAGNELSLSPSLAGSLGGLGATLDFDANSNSISLVLQIDPSRLKTWAGLGGSVFSTAGNWYNGSLPVLPISESDGLIFGDTFDGGNQTVTNGSVTLSGSFTAVSLVFSANTLDYVLSGAGGFAGSSGLIKSGSAKTTLNLANTFTGLVEVNAGILEVQNAAALGSPVSGTNVASGAALALQSASGMALGSEPLTLSGSGPSGLGALVNSSGVNSLDGAVTLGANTTVGISAGSLTLSGAVSGNFALSKGGPGTLVLSGTNTFTGGLLVGKGIVSVPRGAALGGTSGVVVVASGASLDLQNGFSSGSRSLMFSGAGVAGSGALRSTAGDVTWSGSSTLGAASVISVDAGSLTVSGAVGGSFALTKVGAGVLVLSGGNTYNGATTVNAGTLLLRPSAAGSSSGFVFGGATTLGLNVGGAGEYDSNALAVVLTKATWAAGSNLWLDTGNALSSFTYAADFLGQNLLKAGTGSLVLSGTINYANADIAAGTLQFGNGSSGHRVSDGSLRIASGARAAFNLPGSTTVSLLSGSGSVSVLSGSLNLPNANAYVGGTTLSGGVVQLGNANALGSVGTIAFVGGATLQYGSGLSVDLSSRLSIGAGVSATIDTGSNAVTFASNPSFGAGAGLAKSGTGSLTLSNPITYTGTTTIAAGSLILNQGGTSTVTFTSNLAGSGSLQKRGNGTMRLNAANPLFSGTVILSEGGLSLGNAGALGTGTVILGGGTLDVTSSLTLSTHNAQLWSGDFVFAGSAPLHMGTGSVSWTGNRSITVSGNPLTLGGVIADSGTGLAKFGPGSLVLSGANLYTGTVTVAAGTLVVTNALALGGTAAGTTVSNGASLQLQGGLAWNHEPLLLSGTGGAAGGALVSGAGNNVWNGPMTLGGATTLFVGAGGSLSLLGNAVVAGSYTLTVAGAGSTVLGGALVLGGTSAGLVKADAGTLSLNASNSYNGPTTVTLGQLWIGSDGALGSSAGATTVGAGALVDLRSVNYTTTETITLNGGYLNVSSGSSSFAGNVVLGSGGGLFQVDGTALTLSGTISGTSGNSFTKKGLGRLVLAGTNTFQAAVSVNGGALNIQNSAALGATSGATTVVAGAALELQGGVAIGAEPLFLGGAGLAAQGALRNISGNNTFGGQITLSTNTQVQADAGTLTLSSASAISGAYTLTVSGSGNVLISSGVATGGLFKKDAGVLTLAANNSNTGGLTINGGTVVLGVGGSGGALASNSTVTLDSNTWLQIHHGSAFNFNNSLSGAGGFEQIGLGNTTLKLAAQSDFTGPAVITAGTLTLGNANALGAQGAITFNGGVLAYGAGVTTDLSGRLGSANAAINAVVDTNGNNITFSSPLAVSGGLTKIGLGTLTLTADSAFSGTLTVSAGIVALGSGDTTGSVTGNIVNNASLLFLHTGTSLYSGSISGSGFVEKGAQDALTLSGSNSFSGGFVLSNGTLRLGHASALGTGSLVVRAGVLTSVEAASRVVPNPLYLDGDLTLGDSANGGSLSFSSPLILSGNRSLNVTNAAAFNGGVLSTGSGFTLTKAGAGVLGMIAGNGFSGGMVLSEGALEAGGTDAFGTGLLTLLGGRISSNSASDARTVANPLQLAGSLVFGDTVHRGQLTFTGNGSLTAETSVIVLSKVSLGGSLSGAYGFTKEGAADLTLNGNNTFTGVTRVLGGTLNLAVPSVLPAGARVTVSGGGTLRLGADQGIGGIVGAGVVDLQTSVLSISGTADSAFSGLLLGSSGALVKGGPSTLVLTGANTFGGGVTLTNGSLQLGNDSALGGGSLVAGNARISSDSAAARTLVNSVVVAGSLSLGSAERNGVLQFNGNTSVGADVTLSVDSPVTLANLANGTYALTKAGLAPLTLSSSNGYAGNILVNLGSLTLAASGSYGAVQLGSSGTLQWNGSQDVVSLSGSGGLVTGSGTLRLQGNADATFGGVLAGSFGLVKNGAGAFTLDSQTTFSGGVVLNNGVLRVGADSSLGTGTLTLAGGSLSGSDSVNGRTLPNAVRVQADSTFGDAVHSAVVNLSGPVVLSGTRVWRVNSEVAVQGVIADGGLGYGLTKDGLATLTLNGANTFSGTTTVSSGTLALGASGSLRSGVIDVGNAAAFDVRAKAEGWTLVSGQRLTGTGQILGGVSAGAGSLLAPGGNAGLGTLSTGSVSLTGEVKLRLGAGTTGDRLAVNGVLTLGTGSTLTLTDAFLSGLSNFGTGDYILATYTGGLNGTFSNVNLVSSTYQQQLIYEASQLRLKVKLSGTSSLWTASAGDGLWNSTANWNSADAPGVWESSRGLDIAAFDETSAPRTITLAAAKTQLQALSLSAAMGSGYSLVPSGLTQAFWFYNDAGGSAQILVTGGTHTVSVPLVLESDLLVSLGTRSAGLTVSGSIRGTANEGLKITGSGRVLLAAANVYTGQTQVSGGTLVAGDAHAFGSGSLNVSGGLVDVQSVSVSVGTLVLDAGGALLLGTNAPLAVTGTSLLNGTISVSGSVDAANVGRYVLLNSSGALSGSFATGSLPDSTAYYLKATGMGLDLQHRATTGSYTATAGTAAIITGGSAAFTVAVQNGAPLLSDALSFSVSGLTNVTGSISSGSAVAAQAAGSVSGLVFNGTAVGAAREGVFLINSPNNSNGVVSGSIVMDVYGHAKPVVSGSAMVIPDVIVGYGAPVSGGSVSVGNDTGFFVNLKTLGSGSSGFVLVNNVAGLVAGGSAGEIRATLSPGQPVGAFLRTISLNYADDSHLSGASVNLGTLSLGVSGTVYDHASTVFSGGSLVFAPVREGYGAVASIGSLSISNAAGLRVALRTSSLAGGTFALNDLSGIVAGGSGALSAVLAPGRSAGTVAASTVVTFADDSGLAGAATLGSGTVNVSGSVFRLAVGTMQSSALAMGASREGASFVSGSLYTRNTAAADGFSDDLSAFLVSSDPLLSPGGSLGRLVAGGTGMLGLSYNVSTLSPGSWSSAGTVTWTSKGQLGIGLPDATPLLSAASYTLSGSVYRLATGVTSTGVLNLGTVRVGQSVSVGTLVLSNGAAGDGFSDLLGGVASLGTGFTLGGGSFTLAAGSQNVISVGYAGNTATSGVKGGTLTLTLNSLGQLGTGLAPVALASQTVSVTASVYRAGSGTLLSNGAPLAGGGTLNVGNIRVGEIFGNVSLGVLAGGSLNEAYTERLNVLIGGTAGFAVASGGVAQLAAGGSVAGAVVVGLGGAPFAGVGVKTGTVAVSFQTDGQGTSGLSAETVGSQVLNLSGTVYREASALLSAATLNLGAVRAGSSFAGGTFTVSNSASGDGFSDVLGVSSSAGTGFSLTGGSAFLSAGSSKVLNVGYTGDTVTAGLKSGTLRLTLDSLGQTGTGLAPVALNEQTVLVNATVYRPAAGTLVANGTVLAHGGTLNLGKTREGIGFGTVAVDVLAGGSAGDGYTEKLNALLGGTAGYATGSGAVSLLAAGGTAASALALGLGGAAVSSAGVRTGSVHVTFQTDGTGTSGLGLEAVGTQTLNLSGAVYRLASGSLQTGALNFGAVRIGGTFALGTLQVKNTAAADGLSEALNARADGATGSVFVAGGTVGLIAAGSSNVSALQVGLQDTGSAGVKTGAVAVSYDSDGTGTSGFWALAVGSQMATLSGTVYRVAGVRLSAATLNLGTIRAGSTFGGGTFIVSNSASGDGFSDVLGVSSSAGTGFSFTGGSAFLSAGSSKVLNVGYTGDTATVGLKSGTLRLALDSLGQTGTGLAPVTLNEQTVLVNATVYRPAAGALVANGIVLAHGGTLNLGNTREGIGFGTVAVDVLAGGSGGDGYTEKLNALPGGTSGYATGSGAVSLLAAGGTAASALTLGLGGAAVSSAGVRTGSVNVTFQTDGTGTSGLDVAAVGSQTLNLRGTVYRLASGSLLTGAVELGSIREGGTFGVASIGVKNTASADGFSDDLAAVVSASGAGFTASGSLSALAAGSAAASALRVTYAGDTGKAGALHGTTTVAYTSVGQLGTGLADATPAVGSGTIQVSASIYRLAVGTLVSGATVNFGAIREGGTFAPAAISVENKAVMDGYSDDLSAVIRATTGVFTGSGSVSSLAAGTGVSQGIFLRSAGTASSAGSLQETAVVAYTSKGRAGTNLEDARPQVAEQSLTLMGAVYRLATASINGGSETSTLDLGRVHVGGSLAAGSLVLGNGAAQDGYSDDLGIDISAGGVLQLSHRSVYLTAGSSAVVNVVLDAGTMAAGAKFASLLLGLRSAAKVGTGLLDVALPARSVEVTAQVYSGKGQWLTGASGTWADWMQWNALGGRPGLDGVLSRGLDTAVVSSGSGAVVVSLGGATVELSALTLDGAGGVSLTNGTVSLSALAGTPSLSVAGGSHSLQGAVAVSQQTYFEVGQLAKLSIGGLVSGFGGLTKLGEGTLYLASGYTTEGPTLVSAGRLELGVGAKVGHGDISLAQGTQMAFNLNADLSLPNKISGAGSVLTLNPFYNVTWVGGSTVSQRIDVPNGGSVDFATVPLGEAVRITTGSVYLSGGSLGQAVANPILIGTQASLTLAQGETLELSGPLSGTGRVSKLSAGSLILSGSNTYSGGTDVEAGTLVARTSRALGEGGVHVSAAAALWITPRAEAGTVTISNAIAGDGRLLVGGSGRVLLAGTSNAHTGGTEVQGGILEIKGNGALSAGTVTVKDSAVLLASVEANERVTLANVLVGAGELVKEQAGTLVVSGSNTLSRGIVLNAGTLEVGSSAGVGAGLTLNGGVLRLIRSTAGETQTASAVSLDKPVAVAGTVAVNVSAGSTGELAGDLNGAGSLQKTGAGLLTVSGKISVPTGATLKVEGAQSGSTGMLKTGGGTLAWSGVGEIQGKMAVNEGVVDVQGAQVLRDNTKSGTGTLVVSGSARFSGAATLQEGTTIVSSGAAFAQVPLLVVGGKNSAGVLLDVSGLNGGLALDAGQTLKGRGTLRGNIVFGTGSTVAPGNSIDTETVEGAAYFKGGIYEAEYTLSGSGLQSDLLRVIANPKSGSSSIGVADLSSAILVPRATARITDFAPHTSVVLTADKIVGNFSMPENSAVLRVTVSRVVVDGSDRVVAGVHASDIPLREGVEMTVQRFPYSQVVSSGARSQVGSAFDPLITSGRFEETAAGGSLAAVLNVLDAGTLPQVNAILDQLNPQVYAELYSQSLSRLHDIQNTISDRLSALGTALVTRGGAEVLSQSTGAGQEEAWSAWTNTYGSASSHPASGSAGDGGSSLSNFGNVTGVERRQGHLTLGLIGALGTGSEQMNATGARISSDVWHLGLYMSSPLFWKLFMDVSGFYGEAENIVRRTQNIPGVGVYESRINAVTREWLLQVGMGAQLAAEGSRWSIVPSVRGAYAGMRQGSMVETGAGELGVRTDAALRGTFITRTALEVASEWRLGRLPLRASGSAAWVHDFDARPRSMGVRWEGAPDVLWMISSQKQTSDALRVGLSFEIGLGDRRTLRLYGEQEFLQRNKVLRGGISYSIGF